MSLGPEDAATPPPATEGSPVTRPLRGSSGPADAAGLLRAVLALNVTGTLAVAGAGGVRLSLVSKGESVARGALGTPPADDALDLPFVFHPHPLPEGALQGVPELPSRLPDARHPALQSWPDLPGGRDLAPGPLGLRDLLLDLQASHFGGALGGRSPHGPVLALFEEGRLLVALAERDGRTLGRGDALRLLARHATDPHAPPLTLTPLPQELRHALLGVATDRRGDAPDGLRIGEEGAIALLGGVPQVRVAFSANDRIGRFRSVEEPSRLPALELPDDPPGWETQRYALTLRGRDALDPMTELSMRFDAEIGASGKQILRAVRAGHTVGRLAEELGLELDQLGAWLRRLEGDGLIRGEAGARRV